MISANPDMSVNFSYNTYQNVIITRNLHHGDVLRSITNFILDSGTNGHMVNAKHLFISMHPYKGPIPYITLKDGSTRCPIKGIGTIEILTKSNHKIRLHNVIYIPVLNVSLFSGKQHMQSVGCSEHSNKNSCMIVFPSTNIVVDNKAELDFSVCKPGSDHFVAPSFDESTA